MGKRLIRTRKQWTTKDYESVIREYCADKMNTAVAVAKTTGVPASTVRLILKRF